MALWVLLGPFHGHAGADQGSSHSQNLLYHPDNDSGSTEASGALHAFSMCYPSLLLILLLFIFYLFIYFGLQFFTSLINMCLGMFLLGFSLYRILCTSWTSVIFFLSHVREVFNYNLLKYFLWPFLSSPSESLILWILVCLMVSQRSLTLSSFLSILFSLLCSMAVISTILSSNSLIHSSVSIILLLFSPSVLVYFSLQYYIVHRLFVL